MGGSQLRHAHMSDYPCQPMGPPQHHNSHIDGPKLETGVPSSAPIRRVIRKRPREGVDILREVDAGVNDSSFDFQQSSQRMLASGTEPMTIMRALLPAINKLRGSGMHSMRRLNMIQHVIYTETMRCNFPTSGIDPQGRCGANGGQDPLRDIQSFAGHPEEDLTQKQSMARDVISAFYKRNPVPVEHTGIPFPEIGFAPDIFDGVLSNTGTERNQLKRNYGSMLSYSQGVDPSVLQSYMHSKKHGNASMTEIGEQGLPNGAHGGSQSAFRMAPPGANNHRWAFHEPPKKHSNAGPEQNAFLDFVSQQ